METVADRYISPRIIENATYSYIADQSVGLIFVSLRAKVSLLLFVSQEDSSLVVLSEIEIDNNDNRKDVACRSLFSCATS